MDTIFQQIERDEKKRQEELAQLGAKPVEWVEVSPGIWLPTVFTPPTVPVTPTVK